DILAFFTRTTKKASIVLNALKGAGTTWGIHERLLMFKTFALPVPMYGVVILYLMLKTDSDNVNVKQSLELLDHFINEGVRWILSSSVANKSERALLGLVPTKDWLLFMTMVFKQKLDIAQSDAPLALEYQRRTTFYSNGPMIKHLRDLELPDTSNCSLKAAIFKLKRDIYSNVGKLNRYVTSRTQTGVCKTFLYKGENAREYVLFRLGRRLSVDCPLCKKAFYRQHYKCLKDPRINGEPPRELIKLSDDELKRLPKYTVLDQALTLQGLGWVSNLQDPEEDPENPTDVDLLVTSELQEVLDFEIGDDPYLENNLL
ncbi:hypothetical protein MP638_005156, partial [Amoeboaphelidium occidentale]